MRAKSKLPRYLSVIIGLAAAGPLAIAPAAPVGAAQSTVTTTTVWNLVKTFCTSGQAAAGRACYITSGYLDPSTWTITENHTTWEEPGQWQGEYSYQMPDSIPSGGATIPLELASTSQTSGGATLQMCVTQGMALAVSSPNGSCVRASPDGIGSASSSNTLHVTTATAANGTEDVLRVGMQDGPYIYFTYRASNAPRTVNYGFDASAPASEFNGFDGDYEYRGHGSFDLAPPSTSGHNVAGSAMLVKTRGDHTWKVRLTLVKAEVAYNSEHPDVSHPESADGVYKVTHSQLHCLPVGHRVKWSIRGNAANAARPATAQMELPSCDVTLSERASVHLSSTAS